MARKSKQVATDARIDAALTKLEEASTPVATSTPEPKAKTPKLTPAERAAARVAARTATQERGEVARNAAGRPDARGLTCLCGCGEPTHRDEAMFKSGHDARLRKNVIFNKLTFDGLPEIVKPWFKLGEPIAGLLLDEDGVTILDVKAGGGGISEDHELA